MPKKRKSETPGLEDGDKTLFSSFCAAANSLSQLYSQAQNQQRVAFQSGERHALSRLQQWLTSDQGAGGSNSGLVSKEQILDFIQGELDRMDDGPPLGNLCTSQRSSGASVLPTLSGSNAPLLSQLDRCHIRPRGSNSSAGGSAEGGSRRQQNPQQVHHSRQQQQQQHQQHQQHQHHHHDQQQQQPLGQPTFEQSQAVHQVQQAQPSVELPATDARASVNLTSSTGPAPSAAPLSSSPSPLKNAPAQNVPPGLRHMGLFSGPPQSGYHNPEPLGGQPVAQFSQHSQQPSQQYYHQMHNLGGQSMHAFASAGRLTHVIAGEGSASMDT